MKQEEDAGAYDDATYDDFRKRTENSRKILRSFFVQLANEGKTVVGVGCPGRAATLLQYCGITRDLLPYIAEQSTCLKLGMYTPSTHIPIKDEAMLFEHQPDYVLMLSWHYAAPIMKTMRSKGLRSKIILPLPDFQILE